MDVSWWRCHDGGVMVEMSCWRCHDETTDPGTCGPSPGTCGPRPRGSPGTKVLGSAKLWGGRDPTGGQNGQLQVRTLSEKCTNDAREPAGNGPGNPGNPAPRFPEPLCPPIMGERRFQRQNSRRSAKPEAQGRRGAGEGGGGGAQPKKSRTFNHG